MQRGKDRLINKWCSENWIATDRRMQLDPYLTPYTILNSKWVKDLKPRRKHRGKALGHWFHQWFHGYTAKAQAIKAKIDTGLLQTEKFLHSKRQSTEWKGNYRMTENICKTYIWYRVISKIYKDLLQLNSINQITQFSNGLTTWIHISPKRTHK